MAKLNPSSARRAALAASCSLLLASCRGIPPAQKPPVTQQRPLSALMTASAYPNSETLLVLVTMQQLMATHREWEGYQYFGRLSEEQPNRRALFRALQATMQARVANDVPLLRRVSWVEDAIRKLDEGAAAEPVLGRLARGLVFADLPSRFHKAPQAIEDLDWCLDHRIDLPLGLDRGDLPWPGGGLPDAGRPAPLAGDARSRRSRLAGRPPRTPRARGSVRGRGRGDFASAGSASFARPKGCTSPKGTTSRTSRSSSRTGSWWPSTPARRRSRRETPWRRCGGSRKLPSSTSS